MLTRILAICLLLTGLPAITMAQKVRIVNSSEQSWSGGIAGRSGANYSFVVEFSDFDSEPVPDTLWVERQPFPLSSPDSVKGLIGNIKRARTKKTVTFTINAGTFRDEYADRYNVQGDGKHRPVPQPPFDYKGVALLCYRYKGTERYYTVSKIMNIARPAAYP